MNVAQTGQTGRAQHEGRIVSVALGSVETRAALAMAARTGRITATQHRAAVAALPGLVDQIETVSVDDDLLRSAGELAEARALRAHDAVHLAAAIRATAPEIVVVAGDDALLDAAAAEGLATVRTA